VESASSGKTGDVFDQQIKWSDEAMTIALAGQLVTTEGTPGFSNGDPQNEIKQDLTVFDAARLSTALRQQSLDHWALANFGTHTAAPRPKYVTEKPEDINEASDGLQKLGDAILKLDASLKPHGLKVDAEKLVSKFGIPVLSQSPDAAPVPAPEQKAPTTGEQQP
jgi:phage gp29-like protein